MTDLYGLAFCNVAKKGGWGRGENFLISQSSNRFIKMEITEEV